VLAAQGILLVQNTLTKRHQQPVGSFFRPFETPISSAPQGDRVKVFATHHLEGLCAGHVALPEFLHPTTDFVGGNIYPCIKYIGQAMYLCLAGMRQLIFICFDYLRFH